VRFGLASVTLIKVRSGPADKRLVTIGWPYAAVWTVALALRLGFTYGSTHWFTSELASFSLQHHVPGATYGTAFVLMVLAMIIVHTAGVVLRGRAAGASIDVSDLRLARRLARCPGHGRTPGLPPGRPTRSPTCSMPCARAPARACGVTGGSPAAPQEVAAAAPPASRLWVAARSHSFG
jgi:hypothetical protein